MKQRYADGAFGGNCAPTFEQTHGIGVEVVRHAGNRSTGSWRDPQQPLDLMWPEVVAKRFVPNKSRVHRNPRNWMLAR